jgi:putative hydrolase of the HAD superfamily
MKKPYLLFDAGGTLVFPDMRFISEIGQKYHLQVLEDDVFNIYCKLIYGIDSYARKNHTLPVQQYQGGVGWAFFEQMGLAGNNLAQASQEIATFNKDRNLWAFTYSWVFDALEGLQNEGYRMSVLSNADGRVAQSFDELGLNQYFDCIFDSYVLGVEKPDPRIFQVALSELGLQPEETLYVGDVFYIDVWGANQAGLPAVHLDPRKLYEGWSGIHIRSIMELLELLQKKVVTMSDFFPLKGFDLQYD